MIVPGGGVFMPAILVLSGEVGEEKGGRVSLYGRGNFRNNFLEMHFVF